jgi:arylformamidase
MKFLDISLPVSPDLPVWPGDPPIILQRYRSIAKGNASNDSKLACSVHAGTHVDAPAHFLEKGATVEQLPLDTLIGPALVAELPEMDVITPDILKALAIPPETTRLLFKTKNSDLWAKPNPQFNPDYVALSAEAARWIVRRGFRLVGIDYLSIQKFDDPEPFTHSILLDAGMVIVEGLNLQNIKPGSYQLVCLPLKLSGSDGAPARVVLIEN